MHHSTIESETNMSKALVPMIAASAFLAGCQVHAHDGGPTVNKNYSVGNFTAIEVAGPYDVDIRTGSNASVVARGGERLLERTVVEVQGDKLVIRPESEHNFFHWGFGHHGSAQFTVTVPQLNGASIAGSGDIKVDKVNGQAFEGSVAGSGGIDVASMTVQQLKLSIAGSGGVKAGTGSASSADYEIAGSGNIDAGAVQSQALKVSIAGSGGVKAHASGTADVDIMGSGDVNVTGGAKCNVSKAGSGNVSCS
jgi:hypothetical protein